LNKNHKAKKNQKKLVEVVVKKRRKIENIRGTNLDQSQDQGLEKGRDLDPEIKKGKIRNTEDDILFITR